MSTKNKQVVMVIDDSLLICKEIKKALGDEVFICEAHNGEDRTVSARSDPAGCGAAGYGWIRVVWQAKRG